MICCSAEQISSGWQHWKKKQVCWLLHVYRHTREKHYCWWFNDLDNALLSVNQAPASPDQEDHQQPHSLDTDWITFESSDSIWMRLNQADHPQHLTGQPGWAWIWVECRLNFKLESIRVQFGRCLKQITQSNAPFTTTLNQTQSLESRLILMWNSIVYRDESNRLLPHTTFWRVPTEKILWFCYSCDGRRWRITGTYLHVTL